MSDKAPFAYQPVGPRLTAKDLASIIAASGVPLPTAQGRVVIYRKPKEGETLIYVREVGRNTQPNIYEFSDAGVAVLLSALQDAGIQDHEVLRTASMMAYSWSGKADARDRKYIQSGSAHLPRHPIDRAVVGVGMGESWQFLINFWRDTQTGERIIDCDLIQFGDEFIGVRDIPETAILQSGLVIMLDEILLPVVRRLMPENRH